MSPEILHNLGRFASVSGCDILRSSDSSSVKNLLDSGEVLCQRSSNPPVVMFFNQLIHFFEDLLDSRGELYHQYSIYLFMFYAYTTNGAFQLNLIQLIAALMINE